MYVNIFFYYNVVFNKLNKYIYILLFCYFDSEVNVIVFKCFRFWVIKILVLIVICVGVFFILRGEFGIGVYLYSFVFIFFSL